MTQTLTLLCDNIDVLQESLRAIASGVGRGLGITEKILDYAQAADIIAGSAQVEMAELIGAVVANYQPAFVAHQITCEVSTPSETHCFMSEPHARTILVNLLANARDALVQAPEEQPRHIQVTLEGHGDRLTLLVQDNGSGMTPDVQKHVFEPFYSTKGAQGAGLGLALARKIVTAYGGRIEFASEANADTTFRLEIPR